MDCCSSNSVRKPSVFLNRKQYQIQNDYAILILYILHCYSTYNRGWNRFLVKWHLFNHCWKNNSGSILNMFIVFTFNSFLSTGPLVHSWILEVKRLCLSIKLRHLGYQQVQQYNIAEILAAGLLPWLYTIWQCGKSPSNNFSPGKQQENVHARDQELAQCMRILFLKKNLNRG